MANTLNRRDSKYSNKYLDIVAQSEMFAPTQKTIIPLDDPT